MLEEQLVKYRADKAELQRQSSKYLEDRDVYRSEVKEMVDVKNKIEREKNYLNVTNKEIINKLNT